MWTLRDREGQAKVTPTVGEHRGLAAEPPAKGSDLRPRELCGKQMA